MIFRFHLLQVTFFCFSQTDFIKKNSSHEEIKTHCEAKLTTLTIELEYKIKFLGFVPNESRYLTLVPSPRANPMNNRMAIFVVQFINLFK